MVGQDQKLVVDVMEIYNMALSPSLDVESENLSTRDFTLHGFGIDGLTDYSAVTYHSGIVDIERDVGGAIYQDKQYPFGVECQGNSSDWYYFSRFVDSEWTTD